MKIVIAATKLTHADLTKEIGLHEKVDRMQEEIKLLQTEKKAIISRKDRNDRNNKKKIVEKIKKNKEKIAVLKSKLLKKRTPTFLLKQQLAEFLPKTRIVTLDTKVRYKPNGKGRPFLQKYPQIPKTNKKLTSYLIDVFKATKINATSLSLKKKELNALKKHLIDNGWKTSILMEYYKHKSALLGNTYIGPNGKHLNIHNDGYLSFSTQSLSKVALNHHLKKAHHIKLLMHKVKHKYTSLHHKHPNHPRLKHLRTLHHNLHHAYRYHRRKGLHKH
jgi:hypothetical protein